MSFQVAYVPIGVGTFHLESAQDQFEKSIATVSYTHLDVYKRQVWRCTAATSSWKITCWSAAP